MTTKPTGRHVLPVIGAVLPAAVAIPSASGAASTTSSPVPNTPAAGPGRSSTVTLVTGDKVTVTTKGSLPAAISVVGPDGGEAEASITGVGDDTFVHPAAVRPYLASGLIDQRLFNVTRLISDGYDDAHMAHVPLAGSLGVDGLGSRERAMAVQVSGGRPCHHLSATRVAHRDGLPQLS